MKRVALACLLTACGAAKPTPTATIEPLPPMPTVTVAPAPPRSARETDAAPEVLFPGKVTVVHFFASWSMPCVRAMPMLEKLAAARGDRIAVVGIGEDDDEADSRAFVAHTGARFPIRWDGDKAKATLWKPATMPTTFVVDKHGALRFTHLGYTDELEQTLAREVDSLDEER